jgi:hypothetical protein
MNPFRNRSIAVFTLAALVSFSAACSKTNPTSPIIAPGVDITAPTVSSTNPVDGATGASVISATFSEAMTASTITTATFSVAGPGAVDVPGSVVYDAPTHTASFTPTSALLAATGYTATISVGAKDASGNSMASSKAWNFTTPGGSGNPLAPVLASATRFVILAGSTVTNTGPSGLTGDLGLSPGTAVTGFPPGNLSGVIHAGDATSALAMSDLTAAYNDAAGRTLAPVTVAGNLGGQTLAPGLYKSTSSLEVSSGDLTLDAQGHPNAVFIFQIASTLTTTAGRAVILAGGAKASNIFWQVGSSATLGTTSVFKGTIMASQSITLNTGASLDGRALAMIGAVTLDSNAAVLPTP